MPLFDLLKRYRSYLGFLLILLFSDMLSATPLEERLERLEQRLRYLEQKVQVQETAIREKDAQLNRLQGQRAAEGAESNPIEIGGVVEVEAYYGDPYSGDRESDLILATAELGIRARVNEWAAAELVLLYEDDSSLDMDVATLTLSPPEGPWFVTAGQFYLPFGVYESQLVSDPLTLEIGELRETALQLGYEHNGFLGTAYLFNGTNQRDNGADNHLDAWGLALRYAGVAGASNFTATIGFVNDIGDSDALQDLIAGTLGSNDVQDRVAGWHASASLSSGPFTLIGEYLSANERFQPGEVAWNAGGARPSAFNIEVGMGFDIAGKQATFALGYQSSAQALGLGIPKYRHLAAVSVNILENTVLSIEWAHDKDYGNRHSSIDGDGNVISGTGASANTFTTQLAVEF